MSRLRDKAFCDGHKGDPKIRFVSMFHGHIAEPQQQYPLSKFAKPHSTIRVFVCTVAFGMGVASGDVRLGKSSVTDIVLAGSRAVRQRR